MNPLFTSFISLNETPPRRFIRSGGGLKKKPTTSEAKANLIALILHGKDRICSALRTNSFR